MANVNVATFQALKDALANVTAGDSVYITADMDASDYPIASASDEIIIADTCDIYGQGHTIYNITNTSDTNVYTLVSAAQKKVTWQDTNFYNIFTRFTNRYPFISERHSASNPNVNTLYVSNCNFQGQFGSLFGKGHFTKSAINGTGALGRGLTNTPNSMVSYSYLYVNLKNDPSVSGYMLTYAGDVSNCFFTGSVDLSNWAANQSVFAGTGASVTSGFRLNNCIINIDITSDTAASYKWYSGSDSNFNPQGITLFNSSKIQNITFSQSSELLVALTDAELKNAEAVAATGFPIII